MSAIFTSLLKGRVLAVVLLYVAVLSGGGCAYFRWGDPSYSEIEHRTQEEKAANDARFNPATVFEKKEEAK